MKTFAAIVVICGLVVVPQCHGWADEIPAPTQASHPMDALTPDEIRATVDILNAAQKVDDKTKYAAITLHELSKDQVNAWRSGQPLSRQAFAVLLKDNMVYEAVVDIGAQHVLQWREVRDEQPRVLNSESNAIGLLKADARWRDALRARGYGDDAPVRYIPLSPGPATDPALKGRRLVYVSLYDVSDKDSVPFGRPVEGLLGIVDIQRNEVARVIDLGAVPLPSDRSSLHYEKSPQYRTPARPVEISEPAGSNVVLDGQTVRWDNWRFHLRVDQRVGPVLSLVSYDDRGTLRDILYQMSVSEMFVPYMDPAPTWSWRAFMDVGEYGFGLLASPLKAGSDCPATATFLDATVAADNGKPATLKNIVCVFERPTGDQVWRHAAAESRANVQLVVRMAPVIGNYDYLIDYVFDRAGTITVEAGATGIDSTKAVVAQTLADVSARADTATGNMIAKGLVGVNHDHYISFRIDTDIDGSKNRAVFDRYVPAKPTADNPRRSYWRVDQRRVTKAGPLDESLMDGSLRIESTVRKNMMGYPTSYQFMTGHIDTSMLSADDPIQVRASWSAHPVWLSLYDPDQLYASGPYPNQNAKVDGLAKWTAARQTIDDQDVVLWTMVGFRHVTRAEDWPAMPTLWHSFQLRPFNFFDQNPALDVPPAAAASR